MEDLETEFLARKVLELDNEILALKTRLQHLEVRRIQKKRRSIAVALIVFALGSGAFVNNMQASATNSGDISSRIVPQTFSVPPLNSLVTWARHDEPGKPINYTTEVLSLLSEASETNSFLWPLYVELRGTTSGRATMTTSQSAGALVRSFVRSPGSPWTTGFHSELAHGRSGLDSGAVIRTNGTSILFNGEMRSYSPGGRTIGLNLQCVYSDANSKNCDDAINIQAGGDATQWRSGLHFDSKGTRSEGKGIDFDGSQYLWGIDLGNNSIKLNAGQRFALDETGRSFIWFNPMTARVEIVRQGATVASF